MLPTSMVFSSKGPPVLTGGCNNILALFCQPYFANLILPTYPAATAATSLARPGGHSSPARRVPRASHPAPGYPRPRRSRAGHADTGAFAPLQHGILPAWEWGLA